MHTPAVPFKEDFQSAMLVRHCHVRFWEGSMVHWIPKSSAEPRFMMWGKGKGFGKAQLGMTSPHHECHHFL